MRIFKFLDEFFARNQDKLDALFDSSMNLQRFGRKIMEGVHVQLGPKMEEFMSVILVNYEVIRHLFAMVHSTLLNIIIKHDQKDTLFFAFTHDQENSFHMFVC